MHPVLVPLLIEGTPNPLRIAKVIDYSFHRSTPGFERVRSGFCQASVLIVAGCGSPGAFVQERVVHVPVLFLTPAVVEEVLRGISDSTGLGAGARLNLRSRGGWMVGGNCAY